MMQKCLDSFRTSFNDFETMFDYHKTQSKDSIWHRTEIKNLQIAPLDKTSDLYGNRYFFGCADQGTGMVRRYDKPRLGVELDVP